MDSTEDRRAFTGEKLARDIYHRPFAGARHDRIDSIIRQSLVRQHAGMGAAPNYRNIRVGLSNPVRCLEPKADLCAGHGGDAYKQRPFPHLGVNPLFPILLGAHIEHHDVEAGPFERTGEKQDRERRKD